MFTPLDQCYDWNGFYRTPVNQESKYHARANGTADVQWNAGDGIIYQCPFIMDNGTIDLISAVNNCKRTYSHNNHPGGGFSINEYGLVIVPIAGGNNNFILPKVIGKWTGTILFEDPNYDNNPLSLDPDDFNTGDEWELPYLGMKYNLSANNRIYFSFNHPGGQNYINLPHGNNVNYLITALRHIRPGHVPMTFLVNNNRAVIAKADDGDWTPMFVCQLDLNSWFPVETIIQGM